MLYPNDKLLIKVYLEEPQREAVRSGSRKPVWESLLAWLRHPTVKSSTRASRTRPHPAGQEILEKIQPC